MPRIPRNQLPPAGIYHVTVRGVGSTAIVTDDAERELLLALLAREVFERGWRIVAWCLMNTHLHLIVECERASLSAGMQRMNGVYAQGFNRRHARWATSSATASRRGSSATTSTSATRSSTS